MALTPEEMEEIKAELAGRMGGQQDLIPGAKPKLMDVNSTVREGENGFEKDPFSAVREGELGKMSSGGMGFGGINQVAQAPQMDEFNPASEKLLVDPAGMDAGAAARGGFSSSMSLANALRKKGDGAKTEK